MLCFLFVLFSEMATVSLSRMSLLHGVSSVTISENQQYVTQLVHSASLRADTV
jgi:hypothetical protein